MPPISGSRFYAASEGGEAAEEEEVLPGKMKVSEIKAELDLRGVSYAGIFDRVGAPFDRM
jgi:hypothetical protein